MEPEEIDPEVQGKDAIKELANIIGGSAILELGGDDCQYSLQLPELAGGTSASEPGDDGAACFVESEGEILKVVWRPMDSSQSAAA